MGVAHDGTTCCERSISQGDHENISGNRCYRAIQGPCDAPDKDIHDRPNILYLDYIAGGTVFHKAKDGEQAVRANGDWVREMEYAGSLGALGQVSWVKWVEDCFATRLTPRQAGDPAFCHLQRRGSYLNLTQKQHSFLGHMFYKHIGHKDFAMFIFKHVLPEILTTQQENASDDDMISVMQWYGRYAAYREQNVQRGFYVS